MADELEPIRQNIEINVNEKGVDEATGDIGKLNTTISSTTTATSDLSKENKKAEESFKPLKTQLKEAIQLQQRLSAQYGSTSAEATEAARSVAGIRDEIGLQRDLVNSYNPDDKFRELTQTAGLAALALGGVKDGLTAVGIESEFLDKIIGTAQALLGVTSAIGGISDAYEVLTASQRAASASAVVAAGTTEALAVAEGEATVATWSWNSALLANPIVLITAGIVAAGAAIYAYTKLVSDTAKAEELAKVSSMQLNQAIEHQSKVFENNNKELSENNNQKIALLKASGASEKQIYAETQALKAQEIQLAQNYRNKAIRIEQRAYDLDKLNSTEATQEALKNAQENLKKANDVILQGFDESDKIRNDHDVAVLQAETDARNKAEEERKKAEEKAREERKKANEKRIQDAKDLLKSEAQANIDTIKELEEVEKERNSIKAEEEKAESENRVQEMKDFADREIEIEKNKSDQKKAIQDSAFAVAGQAIGLAKDLAGKNKAIQKAAIIAESAIGIGKTVQNVVTGNAAALAQGIVQVGPIAGPAVAAPAIALNTASGILSTAANVAATAKALSALGGGGGASSGGGGAIPQPSRNVAQVGFQSSSENQISTAIAKQQKEQPPIQAFVVSQAVTDRQEIDRKKELANSF